MPYDPRMTAPMREELTRAGFRELRTPEDVDAEVAGARRARCCSSSTRSAAAPPGSRGRASSCRSRTRRRRAGSTTVFAGQDIEATARARSYFAGKPPSSPQVAILSGGKLVFLLQRQEIEGRSAPEIAARLTAAYDALRRVAG